jgi:hypothetical protein
MIFSVTGSCVRMLFPRQTILYDCFFDIIYIYIYIYIYVFFSIFQGMLEKDRHSTNNVTLKSCHANIVAVEKQ